MRRRFQKGQLILRGKIPTWWGSFREDRDGKRVRRKVKLGYGSEMSERQARKALQQRLLAVNPILSSTRKGGAISDAIREWRKQEVNHLKPSTMRAAESHIKHHIEPRLGALPIESLDSQVLQTFVNATTGVRRKTITNITQTVLSIAKAAKIQLRWADIKLPCPEPPKETHVPSATEMGQIIHHAKEPYSTMFLTLATTGMRPGEMLGLKHADLDFNRKVIYIRRSLDSRTRKTYSTKTAGSTAEVPMPPTLEERLEPWRSGSGDFLFTNRNGNPYAIGKVVEYGLWPVQERLRMPRTGLHVFRHAVATELLDKGVPFSIVQRQLRHTDPKTTMRYAHVIPVSHRKAVNALAGRIASGAKSLVLEPREL